MFDNYFIVDIEVAPIETVGYNELDEEQKLKLLNPIDSKIIALGIRFNRENKIFYAGSEREIIESFWKEWASIKQKVNLVHVVGFNINNFDLPFITTRSLINKVVISPFTLKYIIDLREKINAYRYGKSRGKLKELALLLNLPVKEIDGSDIGRLYIEGRLNDIKEYLENDLEITDEIFKRAKETKILEISKW